MMKIANVPLASSIMRFLLIFLLFIVPLILHAVFKTYIWYHMQV